MLSHNKYNAILESYSPDMRLHVYTTYKLCSYIPFNLFVSHYIRHEFIFGVLSSWCPVNYFDFGHLKKRVYFESKWLL